MKKLCIAFALALVLICAFAVCTFAVSPDDLASQENLINISALIKVLEENNVPVDTAAPFQDAHAGQISFSPVFSGITFESSMTLADLIEGYDPAKSYVFYVNTRPFIGQEEIRALSNESAVIVYAGDTALIDDLTELQPFTGLPADSLISMYFYDSAVDLHTPIVAEYDDVCTEIHVTNSNWPRSADYEAGYLYQPEVPDEPTTPTTPAGDDAEDPPAGGGTSEGSTTILDGVSDAVSGVTAAVSGAVTAAVPEWQQAGAFARVALVLVACGGGLLLVLIILRPAGAHVKRRRR